MITIYTGTPGSGKSLHMARRVYYSLRFGKPVISNVPINTAYVKNPGLYTYLCNDDIQPRELMRYSREWFGGKGVKEGSILLIIDEAQMMFNARTWSASGREDWNSFFQLHRHYGYDIILVAQFDRMIDRQIRSLIEYECVHRKVSNLGARGKLLCAVMLAPSLFCCVRRWYPLKERVESEFFRYSKKYGRIYDTFMTFDNDEQEVEKDNSAMKAGD